MKLPNLLLCPYALSTALLLLFAAGCSSDDSSGSSAVSSSTSTETSVSTLQAQLAAAQADATANATKLTNGASYRTCITAATTDEARADCNKIAF